ncbi:MAG: cobalt ECF transporter T component CbiQ [Calditrichae bacterium]|nr:cobalt ECF transporter T component CbiQ [Calditrichia bacterium]
MRHEFFDHHREGNSLLHRFDPRLKLAMMLSFIAAVVITSPDKKILFLLYTGIVLVLALMSQVPLVHLFGKLLKLYPMIFFISVFVPFFPAQEDLSHSFGFITIYEKGFEKFLLINIKAVLAIFMSILITTTTDLMLLLKGMESLKIPKLAISIVSFMYRFIFLLIDEVERMIMAFQSRYFRLSLKNRINTFAKMIGVLFIRTYERGERIFLAMESRGFKGEVYTYTNLKWKKSDSFALTIFLIILYGPVISLYLIF